MQMTEHMHARRVTISKSACQTRLVDVYAATSGTARRICIVQTSSNSRLNSTQGSDLKGLAFPEKYDFRLLKQRKAFAHIVRPKTGSCQWNNPES